MKGFSLVEVILSLAIFTIISTGVIVLIIGGFNTNRLGAEETVAAQYAAEGIEAVKSIKNQSYASLVNTSGTGIVRGAGNVWTLGGGNNTFSADKTYTRTIKIESVSRDNTPPAGNIVASGGTVDADTKKVTSTVDWNFTSFRPESISYSTYFSDWRKVVTTPGPIMMAYSKTTTTPFYRIWDGTTWSAEGSAQAVGGNINFIVLKSARTRNESVLGTLDSNGNIYAQVWNGTTWGTPTLMANVGAANATTRSFDMEYEKNGDRLVFVYLPAAASADFAYRIWDGATWSVATTITAPPTTGVVKWIELAQNPISSSNEVSMIMIDANIDIYGMAWNGSAWGTMGTAVAWDTTGSTATAKSIDVAYEQSSGRAVFIWGDSVATNQMYRIWNGTTLTAATTLTIAAAGGLTNWVDLAARPSSNELMYAEVDAGADLNTRKWSGTAWDTATQHPEHSAAVENITSMVFDVVWETHSSNSGKAWLLFGDGATVTAKQWSGSAWGAGSVLAGSDDTSFIRLKADPISGAVFAGIYQNITSAVGARDIGERHLTGGGAVWTAKNVIWGGPTTAEPVHFRIDFATP